MPVPAPSLEERLARIERMRVQDASIGIGLDGNRVELPMPQVREVSEWPDGAALWLYKAGLSKADIGRLGIYYHPPTERVVLPHGAYYQARAWQPGRAPKYLAPTPKPSNLLVTFGKAECATLTEDMLSAMKVGDVGEGWAVLGTAVSDHMIAALLKRGTPVNLALDPDAAGRKGARKYAKQLRAYGLTVRDILFPRDPKLMFRSELKEYLT
jgi:DNA primase